MDSRVKKWYKGGLALVFSLVVLFESSLTVWAATDTSDKIKDVGMLENKDMVLSSDSSSTLLPAIPQPSPSEDAPEPRREGHKHSYSYVVIQEPIETQDGLGESRCECGAVEWSQVIPAGTAYVKNVLHKIRSIEENGVVEIQTDVYSCYTAKIINELLKRPDVTLKTSFTDKDGNTKSFTIPAGQAPTDGAEFYGFTYLGNLYGWDELNS